MGCRTAAAILVVLAGHGVPAQEARPDLQSWSAAVQSALGQATVARPAVWRWSAAGHEQLGGFVAGMVETELRSAGGWQLADGAAVAAALAAARVPAGQATPEDFAAAEPPRIGQEVRDCRSVPARARRSRRASRGRVHGRSRTGRYAGLAVPGAGAGEVGQ